MRGSRVGAAFGASRGFVTMPTINPDYAGPSLAAAAQPISVANAARIALSARAAAGVL